VILLDTHAWTRWLHPELGPNLTPSVRPWIEESDEDLAVSVISCLEISQLVKKGTLTLPMPLPRWFEFALDAAGIACRSAQPCFTLLLNCPQSIKIPLTASSSPQHNTTTLG